jgi:four helix bundle protein
MRKTIHKPKYDLEERTTKFAKSVINICKKIKRDEISRPLIYQIVRCSASVGANYREANDSLGKKDFIHRLRISRKEAKESIHFLILLGEANMSFQKEIDTILNEANEIKNILSSIINKCL